MEKLETTLAELEYDMAMRLIERINPDAAPRIAEMLQASEASGAPGAMLADRDQQITEAGSPSGGGPADQPETDAGHLPGRRQTPGRAA